MKKEKKNEIKTETYFMLIITLLLLLICCFGAVHLSILGNEEYDTNDKNGTSDFTFTRSNINYLKNVELEDDEREIVYDGEDRKTNKYPVINISSDEVDELNREIYYLQVAKVEEGKTLSYEYGVYNKYLIVNLVAEKDACNLEFINYIVNIFRTRY